MREVLRVNNLSKRYKRSRTTDILAVDNISFSINSGEIVGFLGPNGAGKSTTIKMIAGLANPTSGDIYVLGKDILREREDSMNAIGGVIENPDMYGEWTAYENLMYFTSLHIDKTKSKEDNTEERKDFRELNKQFESGAEETDKDVDNSASRSEKSRVNVFSKLSDKILEKYENKKNPFINRLKATNADKIKVDEVLELVGLSARKNDKIKTFSLGMKQRLGIAQAIMDNPALLILDEPANGLDPAGIKELRDMLRNCAEVLDMGVLVSSHQLAEMELMCDRYIIIDRGKIVQEKTMVRDEDITETNGEKVVAIRVDRLEEAKSFLQNLLGVEAEIKGAILRIRTAEEIAVINKELVKADFNVSGIEVVKETLEESYLSVTRKIGSE